MEGSLQALVTSRDASYIQCLPRFSAKRCLRIPDEAIETTNIKLQSDLTYEEKSIQVLEEMERASWNKVIKFYKVVWNNHGEQDATWEWVDYLREVYPAFYEKW